MNLPFTQLRAFAATYEAGGVRPAARALHITHSAVSRHLKELETWVGIPLLERQVGTRKLVFSSQGHALARATLTCFAELDNVVASIRESKKQNSITIATTPSFATRWLLPRLASLEKHCGGIELSVVVDQRTRSPADEGADLTIRMGNRPAPGLIGEPLMDDILYPVMNADYWAANNEPNALENLTALRLLHDRDPNTSWVQWKKAFGPNTLDTRQGSRFTSSDLVLCAAEQGLGVALARDQLASGSIDSGDLIRPFGEIQLPLQAAYWLVHAPRAMERADVKCVVEWLREEVSS
jgi:LysR family glycine cleavage system transcriptional activator